MRRQAFLLLMFTCAAIVLSSGVAIALTEKQCDPSGGSYSATCIGTEGRDHLKGTEGEDFMFGVGKADTIEGFAGSDILFGGPGNDKIFGGAGRDYIQGDAGDDVLEGGKDQGDSYYFGGDGKDVIVDVSNPDTDPSEDNSLVIAQLALAVTWPVYSDLTINLKPSKKKHEVTDASGKNTINWKGNAIATVIGGRGDDTITGNDYANYLDGGGGANTISGRGGDDVIRASGEHNVVECGDGNDTVYYDSTDEIASDCENQILSS